MQNCERGLSGWILNMRKRKGLLSKAFQFFPQWSCALLQLFSGTAYASLLSIRTRPDGHQWREISWQQPQAFLGCSGSGLVVAGWGSLAGQGSWVAWSSANEFSKEKGGGFVEVEIGVEKWVSPKNFKPKQILGRFSLKGLEPMQESHIWGRCDEWDANVTGCELNAQHKCNAYDSPGPATQPGASKCGVFFFFFCEIFQEEAASGGLVWSSFLQQGFS